MISLFPDGTYQVRQRLCNCPSCLLGLFNECSLFSESGDVCQGVSYEEIPDGINKLDETDNTVGDLYIFTEPGNYVALYSASNFEMFYLFYVTKKGVADTVLHDIHGHIVQESECYLEGYYLQKVKESKKKIYYTKGTLLAYVHPQSMFCPNVSFNEEEMCMEKILNVTLCQFMLNYEILIHLL